MLEGKLIIIHALGHQNKGKSSFTGSGLFVLMAQCGNNNELALQDGAFCTMWSLVAKGLFIPTPLAPKGVVMFIDESPSYSVLERASHHSFKGIWIEFNLHKLSNVICGVNIIPLMNVSKLTLPDETLQYRLREGWVLHQPLYHWDLQPF